ncbi:MAG: hypothetical protein QXH27_01965 [Candidatus Micrarchaeia archaeon]
MATAGFHFLFTLIALYAARLHVRHHHLAPLLFAFLAFFPDVDYFIGIHRATLHNIFITLLLPAALLILALTFQKRSIILQESLFLATLVLFSHPVFDLFYGPVELLYPMLRTEFSLAGVQLTAQLGGAERVLVSAPDFGMLAYAIILIPAFFLEEILELRGLGGVPTRNSLRTIRRQVEAWLSEL